MWSILTTVLLLMSGVFLMFIVLLQRGRGGGLAGAFGGLGGQSAFGTKAGDVFTKITVGIAVVWVILAGVSSFALRAEARRGPYKPDVPAAGEIAPLEKAGSEGATEPSEKSETDGDRAFGPGDEFTPPSTSGDQTESDAKPGSEGDQSKPADADETSKPTESSEDPGNKP